MFPWGHLAVGYLVYTVGIRAIRRRTPAGGPVLVLALGTQFPDLIDKPLSWWVGIYGGRAVAHSLLTLLPLCTCLVLAARRRDWGPLAVAFSVGVLTHVAGDAASPLVAGNIGDAAFLLWPLFPAPTNSSVSLVEHLRAWVLYLRLLSTGTPTTLVSIPFARQLFLGLLVIIIWVRDGAPGIATLRNLLTH